MQTKIYGVTEDARLRLIADMGQRWYTHIYESDYEKCHDFILNENVILKTNEYIWLDLGGRKSYIRPSEFVEVDIV